MVLKVILRGIWDSLMEPELRMGWEETVLIVGIFMFFAVIQYLTLRCHRRGVRYIPLLLMTVLWIVVEYLVASEPSMGAAVLVMIAGYPVILGWMGTILACILWHVRKHFRKTA